MLDADGNPFRNQGQCVSYVVQGGSLAPVIDAYVDVKIGTQTIGSCAVRMDLVNGDGLDGVALTVEIPGTSDPFETVLSPTAPATDRSPA